MIILQPSYVGARAHRGKFKKLVPWIIENIYNRKTNSYYLLVKILYYSSIDYPYFKKRLWPWIIENLYNKKTNSN